MLEKKWPWVTMGVLSLVLIGIGLVNVGYHAGYREGQLEYARGHLRWSIMDGIVVEFHGLDVQEAKE